MAKLYDNMIEYLQKEKELNLNSTRWSGVGNIALAKIMDIQLYIFLFTCILFV